MEREVGGGIGMGKTCKPMAVSFQCMTKFTTNKKKKDATSKGIDKKLNESTSKTSATSNDHDKDYCLGHIQPSSF